jgi:hypothetical protein
MTCNKTRRTVLDAARGEGSLEREAHLTECAPCRAALDAERDLLARIDGELEAMADVAPSPTFLPGVRRRVAALPEGSEWARRRWLVPALATLVGVLVAGHLLTLAPRGTTSALSPVGHGDPVGTPVADRVRSASAPALAVPGVDTLRPTAVGGQTPTPFAIEGRPAPGGRGEPGSHRSTGSVSPSLGAEATPGLPRVFVPPEDAQVVRRLARRLRGRAVRAAVQCPETERAFDLAQPLMERPAVVSVDPAVFRTPEPRFEEPPSYDRTVGKAGRKT